MDWDNTNLHSFNTIKLICDGDSKIPFNIKNNKINLYCECLVITSYHLLINVIKKHYNDDLTRLDYDLFDAIDRKVLIKYMGFDPRSS